MLRPLCIWVLILLTFKVNAIQINDTKSWGGNWFPRNPLEKVKQPTDDFFNVNKVEINPKGLWTGKWFPYRPTDRPAAMPQEVKHIMNVDTECDDGKNNIDTDYDPANKVHSHYYLCLDLKGKYEPSFATSPIQREYIIPSAYKAPSYCLNETIEYEEQLPTFGAHRYVYPKYGEYNFLPIQRWMHNLEYGAIVMLYHPCAFQMQVEKLRHTVNACLYRHIITPSTVLTPERPLALVAWGKSLEMSVVDVSTVVNFIKENAKKGANTMQQDIQEYNVDLIAEAKLVTDESDIDICANISL